jgi:hypothetical protein
MVCLNNILKICYLIAESTYLLLYNLIYSFLKIFNLVLFKNNLKKKVLIILFEYLLLVFLSEW